MDSVARGVIVDVPRTKTQRLRSLSLAFWVLVLFAVPLLSLAAMDPARSPGTSGLASFAGRIPSGGRTILGAPWSLDLWGFEIMDPLAFLGLVLAGAFTVSALIATIPTLVLLGGLGRFFCGWVCPYVPLLALSNRLRSMMERRGFAPPDLRLPKETPLLVLGGLSIITVFLGAQVFSLVYPPAILARTVSRAVIFGGVGLGAGALSAVWLFDTFVSRAGFCRSLCPGGALMALIAFKSPVRVVRDAETCTHCKDCDVVCNLGQRPMSDKLDGGCERCGKCIDVCEVDALKFVVGKSRLPVLQNAQRKAPLDG